MQFNSIPSEIRSFWSSRQRILIAVALGLAISSSGLAIAWVWSDLHRQARAHFKVWEEDISEELLAPQQASQQAPLGGASPQLLKKVIAHWQSLAPWTEVRQSSCHDTELRLRLPLSLYGTTAQELNICTRSIQLISATFKSPQGTAMLLLSLLIFMGFSVWTWLSWQKEWLTQIEIQAHRRQSLWSERLAHDLRSPLMALRSLEADWPRDSSALFQATLKRLESMADQLLSEGRRLGTSRSLRQSLQTLLAELATRFKAAKQSEVIDELQRDELIDEDVERALHALLHNALEASGDLPVKIHMSCTPHSLQIQIHDRGPGVSEALLKQLGRERLAPRSEKPNSRGVGAWSAGETARARGGDLKYRLAEPHGLVADFSVSRLGTRDESENPNQR
ncbi:MAG TPA: hypothetical protein PLZ57_07830 [Pseudobdellovibrionaceae bacterium]|nr:hypothetical protein [Pseudobdellovibrionaceae bacterium]